MFPICECILVHYRRTAVNVCSQQCDEEGRFCYLESSNVVNVPLYEKLGFGISDSITFAKDPSVALDIMVREPMRVS